MSSLTVNGNTGSHGGPFLDETLMFGEAGVLRVIGFVGIPGDKYPWSWLPRSTESPA